MGQLESFWPDGKKCEDQLGRFKRLLEENDTLEERKDVLRMFDECRDLAAFLGTYHPDAVNIDRVAIEYPIFGTFQADLVVGDSENKAFCFVEFENAFPHSIFKKGKRTTTFWSQKFLGGYSQLVDWFWKLEDEASTGRFTTVFDGRQPRFVAMLVMGRDHHLSQVDRMRLEWWRANVQIGRRHVFVRTFDELYRDLARRFADLKGRAAHFTPGGAR